MWRPPENWKNPYFKVNPELGIVDAEEGAKQRAYEEGANAMHKADIEYLKKHTISKPTDRFKVISIHEEEWRDFIKEEKC